MDKEKEILEQSIAWLKARVVIDDVYNPHLKFIMKDFADKIHEIRKENGKS